VIRAVSNIAWPPKQRYKAYRVLEQHGYSGLEIAPGLLFAGEPDVFSPSEQAIERIRSDLTQYGLHLVSMQSLLFGVENAELFGRAAALDRFEAGMRRAIKLAGRLGISNLVFGSPKQRVIPNDLSRAEAERHAVKVFCRLGDDALRAGTAVSLETNPAAYGTNFLTKTAETVSFVQRIDHPAIKLNLDIGAMEMNGEPGTAAVLWDNAHLISHVHVSTPNLAPAPRDLSLLTTILRQLRRKDYARAVSIEMLAPENPIETLRTRCAILSDLCDEVLGDDDNRA